MDRYFGTIALTKLKHAIVDLKNGKKGIVLPIEDNYIFSSENGLFMPVNVIIKEELDQYDNIGFISQQLPTEIFKQIGEEKAKELKLPILGSLKPKNGKYQDMNTGDAQYAIEEDNELPF